MYELAGFGQIRHDGQVVLTIAPPPEAFNRLGALAWKDPAANKLVRRIVELLNAAEERE